MIVAYQSANGWHAASTEGLIAYNEPSEAALKAAISRVVDGNFEIQIVDAQTWRATYLSALAADSLEVQQTIEALEQSVEVEKLHSRLDMFLVSVDELRRELAAERERVENEDQKHEQDRQNRVKLEAEAQQRNEQAAAAAEVAKWEGYLADKRVEVVGDIVKLWQRHLKYRHDHDTAPIKSWLLVDKWSINEAPPAVLAKIKR